MRWLGLVVISLAACSPVYVYKAWRGQSRILASRRPIETVVADPATPAGLREKLRLVGEIRRFAFDVMSIPPTANYGEYAPVPGPAVSYALSASRKTRLQAKTWWFPFVGRVPYKGYFEREDAEREGAGLERAGWDVSIGGVSAYSTLRWFRDPVLSTMLREPAGETAELLLHELTHITLFFKGQADFDEAFATFCGEEGAQDFLARRFGARSPELADYRASLSRERERSKIFDELYAELQALYGGAASESAKLREREPIFARYRERLHRAALNNAVVLAHWRYRYDLSDFRRAHRRFAGDWKKTLAFMKGLDRRQPREDLKRRLGTAPR